MFLFVTTSLLVGLNLLVHWRVSEALGLGKRARRFFVAILILMLAGNMFPRLIARRTSPDFGGVVGAFASTFELGIMLAAVPLLAFELARLVSCGVRRLRRGGARPPAEGRGALATSPRREFLTKALVTGAVVYGGGSAAYGGLVGRRDYELTEVPIPIPGLAASLDGFVIAQLSDIHIGTYVGKAELDDAVELVRRAKPDLVVLTGDLVDRDADYAPALADLVARLAPLAKHGVAAIAGNHDYYTGVDEVLGAVQAGGGRVLRNDAQLIGDESAGFSLLGVDDVFGERHGGGPDLARAMAAAHPTLPRILLCHNPVFFPEAAPHVALQLSGHTHGGQINPGVRPADFLLPYGYVAGRYEREGAILYVNRGFGTVGPTARVMARPEVTRVVLGSA